MVNDPNRATAQWIAVAIEFAKLVVLALSLVLLALN